MVTMEAATETHADSEESSDRRDTKDAAGER